MKWAFTSKLAVPVMMIATAFCQAQETPPPISAPNAGASVATANQPGESAPAAANSVPAYQIGGSVQPPVAIHLVNPKFSRQARKARFSGQVIVGLIVDKEGMPQNVHVVRGVGMGLDEEAMKAVKQYKFKPATRNGEPVAVYLNVQINFQIVTRS